MARVLLSDGEGGGRLRRKETRAMRPTVELDLQDAMALIGLAVVIMLWIIF